mmetsp:Transcript_15207/g.25047  ORF Transcript_15207/g.25047 Transcript_15207/m.25047 type:complete len:141 (+) Transcript_15207:332-754(+)
MAATIVASLLFLESENSEKEIQVYINSPGGLVTAGMAIYDTMQYIKCPVSTICIGQACSMASLLLTAGTPGLRRSLPNARIMLHQPSGGAQVGYDHSSLPFPFCRSFIAYWPGVIIQIYSGRVAAARTLRRVLLKHSSLD